MRNRIVILIILSLLASLAWGQQPAPSGTPEPEGHDMSGMDMSGHAMSNTKERLTASDEDKDSEGGMHAMHSMEGHMDMGPHMKMTALRPARPGDTERAQQVVEAARRASGKIHRLPHRAGRRL